MATVNGSRVVEGLRAWARGNHPDEAAVELLVRAFAGRFAEPRYPWVREGDEPGRWWLDPDAVYAELNCYSGGEQRVLLLVASLLGGGPAVTLFDALPGLDRTHLALVLAAVSHAGGSHEHSTVARRPAGYAVERLGALYPWPAPRPGAQP